MRSYRYSSNKADDLLKWSGYMRDKNNMEADRSAPQRDVDRMSDNKSVLIKHTVEDGNNVVRIYRTDGAEFRVGRWPIDETNHRDVIDCLWGGYYDALDWIDFLGAETLRFESENKSALHVFDVEVKMHE